MGLILCSLGGPYGARVIGVITLVSLGLNHIAWRTLLGFQETPDLSRAVQPVRTPMNLVISIWVGHILPAAVLLTSMGLVALPEVNHLVKALLGLSGVMIVIGATGQKAAVILGANSLKAIKPGPPKPGSLFHAR
jgi:hypothetical protein